ncbi:MAG: pyruvate kinase [Parachlamydiaceae bacterium]|nr:pyruvate kinase [Parachlamydiaceae bacterium]
MTRRTKIICTIGPAVSSLESIKQLIAAGMDGARLNFSHGTHNEHLEVINRLKEARRELKTPLAIILDTKGPEIRVGKIQGNELLLQAGQKWMLVGNVVEGNAERASITPGYVLEQLKVGMTVLFDDGYISSQVLEVGAEGVIVQIHDGGVIRSNKGVNVPNANLSLPAMTAQDIADIKFGCQNDVDIIAASFVRSADHLLEIKKLIASENKPDILVMAKIENSEGVHNFDTIVQVSDGIMIARGDLGVEVPLSDVPRLQKMMIRKSYLAGKPAITATQMLESMIQNPRPTRAEASDVANAIYDSTSAVMLSGETAVGKYPLAAVNVMTSIIKAAEADFNYQDFFQHHADLVYHDVPSAVTLATVKASYTSNAQAIFAFTHGGSTARLLSRLRPSCPIIAMTPSEKCYHQMACNWGVTPILGTVCSKLSDAFTQISTFALEHKLVDYGDLVIINAGSPFGISGTTNMMVMENIGDVLVRGHTACGVRIHGNVAIVLSVEAEKRYRVKDKLIVITKCDESYLHLIQEASGIILQNHIDDVASEKYALEIAQKLNKTALVRADAASRILKEGQLVTIDPEKALVYNRIFSDHDH